MKRDRNPIRKGLGVTESERRVAELCQGTFLSLWSYPSVYRDQRAGERTEGKELCDVLVVFDNHVVIFSDKFCKFPSSGDLDLDWKRWHRRAIQDSAKQLWGAERWLRTHPDRVFLDRGCTQAFPVPIPDPSVANYHLVVVAHGVVPLARKALGGSGGLVVTNLVKGDQLSAKPFTAGDLDPQRTFVHVFDDLALPITLSVFDTIADLVHYLDAREKLLRSSARILARSEQELVAVFRSPFSPGAEEMSFPQVAAGDDVFVDEGRWDELISSTWWQSEVVQENVSYAWDHLIESFAGHTLNDTRQFAYPREDFQTSEILLRFLAREPRTRRRVLGQSWLDALLKSVEGEMFTRWHPPANPDDVHYVFLYFPRQPERPYEEYRTGRRNALEACCRIAKLRHPESKHIVGIATESGQNHYRRAEDAMYLDASEWTDDDQAEAEMLRDKLGFSKTYSPVVLNTAEITSHAAEVTERMKQSVENSPCYCGSNRLYRDCHAKG